VFSSHFCSPTGCEEQNSAEQVRSTGPAFIHPSQKMSILHEDQVLLAAYTQWATAREGKHHCVASLWPVLLAWRGRVPLCKAFLLHRFLRKTERKDQPPNLSARASVPAGTCCSWTGRGCFSLYLGLLVAGVGLSRRWLEIFLDCCSSKLASMITDQDKGWSQCRSK
jgi:hypothetical protein